MPAVARCCIALTVFALEIAGQTYTISTIAGTDRLLDGSQATSVPLRLPISTAVDAQSNVYIADFLDNRVRVVNPAGVIQTVAGTGLPLYSGDRGKASAASLASPVDVAVDTKGNLYIADRDNYRVRKIGPDGIINTVAGSGAPGSSGDGQSALKAQLIPIAVLPDSQGNLYIADIGQTGTVIRKVDLNGQITTVAGSGNAAFSGVGKALSVNLGLIVQMALDSKGNLYLADAANFYVFKIDGNNNLTAIAGSGTGPGTISDGQPANGAVMIPQGIAFDSSGSLYISDGFRNLIFRVDSGGLIHTFAGTGTPGFSGDHGAPILAQFYSPGTLAFDSSNNLYLVDEGNLRVRKIAGGIVTTLAGTDIRDGGPATSAFLSQPGGLAVDGSLNILVADSANGEARLFQAGGNIRSVGQFNGGSPQAVAVDQSGNFYVTDDEPYALKITPAGTTSVVAGNGSDGYTGDGGRATAASISEPSGVAVDSASNVYITDYTHKRIREITASDGKINTIAGNGSSRYVSDNLPASAASMDPTDIAIDSKGNIFVADEANHRIRRIDANRVITTVAGNGSPGFSGDGGPATAAQLFAPSGVSVDNNGNLYIADFGNFVVRRVNPDGLISTIAGTPGTGMPASGDGGVATSAQMSPLRVAVDAAGAVYVSDSLNDRIRKLTPKLVTPSTIRIVSGNNQTASVGTTVAGPLTVQVLDASGAPAPGVEVTFTVAPSAAATVSPSPCLTLADGTASARATLGNTAGSISITAAAVGVATRVSFTITAAPIASPTDPVISTAGVASAAGSIPPVTALSPNAMISIFGLRFAPPGTARQVGPGDLVNGKAPANFADVCVQVGPQRAAMLGVYPNQLNVQVPTVAPQSTTVQVIIHCDTSGAQTSNAYPVVIQATAPEFFYLVRNPNGQNPIIAYNATTGAFVAPPDLFPGLGTVTAKPRDVISLLGTGFGLTNPAVNAGEYPNYEARVTASVTVTVGGVPLDPSLILYAGATPEASVYRLTIQLPDSVPDGNQAVVVTLGGVSSPPNAYITIARQ